MAAGQVLVCSMVLDMVVKLALVELVLVPVLVLVLVLEVLVTL